jgi:hypothetical protein
MTLEPRGPGFAAGFVLFEDGFWVLGIGSCQKEKEVEGMGWESAKVVLEEEGAVMCRGVVDGGRVRGVIEGLERVGGLVARRSGVGYAARNVLATVEEAGEMAVCAELMALLEGLAGPGFFAVRGILFDKVPGANWPVGWHQDLVIAVKRRVEAAGYGPWSVKAGVVHVRPPAEVLKGMLTLRVHLDDCPEANGALKVVAGSHVRMWGDDEVMGVVERGPVRVMEARAGDVLVMRPLALHASGVSVSPGHRRVLHVEYAREGLGGGVEWAEP